MKRTSPTILFFGNERLATGVTTSAPTLSALVQAGYNVAAVVVAQRESDKSRRVRPLEVAEVAAQYKIPVLAIDKLKDNLEQLAAYKADAAVLVAYGKIVPQAVIDLFPRGIINIHPSLLPLHRGPTPLESVILGSEPETGVSLMQLVLQMDAGPVYAQETVLLRGDETKQALADQLLELGKTMLLESLPAILDGSLKPNEQDSSHATIDHMIKRDDSELDFQQPVVLLERQVRAYAGWPRSRAKIGTSEVIITAAHVAADMSGVPGTLWLAPKQLGIYAKDGVLVIDRLIPNGKKEMSAEAFLAGYQPSRE